MLKSFSFFLIAFFLSSSCFAQRQMEQLDRGVVAVRNPDLAVFVSWRLLATEAHDLSFNLYRVMNGKTVKLNRQPISTVTSFTDSETDTTSQRSYYVKTMVKGKEGQASRSFILSPGSKPYFSIHLKTPAGYAPNDASVADLDGDGSYEI